MIQTLNKLFIARYSKKFAELNKNIYIAPKNDDGTFDTPVPTLSAGGATIVKGSPGDVQLKSPASVSVTNRKMKAYTVTYRIGFPRSEMEIAVDKPDYFNYLLDAIIEQALANYRLSFGDENKIRFGSAYCTYERPNSPDVFTELTDDYVELRLSGDWASNEEAT